MQTDKTRAIRRPVSKRPIVQFQCSRTRLRSQEEHLFTTVIDRWVETMDELRKSISLPFGIVHLVIRHSRGIFSWRELGGGML